jgi:hypothetical protein
MALAENFNATSPFIIHRTVMQDSFRKISPLFFSPKFRAPGKQSVSIFENYQP